MLRSLYSGISGMKNFQTKLDAIGNNIANVNTYGYKKSRVTFKDAISQTSSGATGPQAGIGGTNAVQVGLGSKVGSIDTIDTQGSFETTGRVLDLAISGDGYFEVTDGNQNYYTRAGNFYLDADNNLVNSDGYKVLDSSGNAINLSNLDGKSFDVGTDGSINYTDANGNPATLNQKIAIATFANPSGLTKEGGNLYSESVNSGAPNTTAASNNQGTINSGYLEMSNVDLSDELTNMIVAERGFQSNTRIITTSDEILQELVNLKR